MKGEKKGNMIMSLIKTNPEAKKKGKKGGHVHGGRPDDTLPPAELNTGHPSMLPIQTHQPSFSFLTASHYPGSTAPLPQMDPPNFKVFPTGQLSASNPQPPKANPHPLEMLGQDMPHASTAPPLGQPQQGPPPLGGGQTSLGGASPPPGLVLFQGGGLAEGYGGKDGEGLGAGGVNSSVGVGGLPP